MQCQTASPSIQQFFNSLFAARFSTSRPWPVVSQPTVKAIHPRGEQSAPSSPSPGGGRRPLAESPLTGGERTLARAANFEHGVFHTAGRDRAPLTDGSPAHSESHSTARRTSSTVFPTLPGRVGSSRLALKKTKKPPPVRKDWRGLPEKQEFLCIFLFRNK